MCLRGSPIGVVSTKQKESFRRLFYPKVFEVFNDPDSQYKTKVQFASLEWDGINSTKYTSE